MSQSMLLSYKKKAIYSTPFVCEVCNLEFKNVVDQGMHFELAHPRIKEVILQDGRQMDLNRYCIEFGLNSNSNSEPTQSNINLIQNDANKRSVSSEVSTNKGKGILSNNGQGLHPFAEKFDLDTLGNATNTRAVSSDIMDKRNEFWSNKFQPSFFSTRSHPSFPNKFGLYTKPEETQRNIPAIQNVQNTRNVTSEARDKGKEIWSNIIQQVNSPLPNEFGPNEKIEPTGIQNVLGENNAFFEAGNKGKEIWSNTIQRVNSSLPIEFDLNEKPEPTRIQNVFNESNVSFETGNKGQEIWSNIIQGVNSPLPNEFSPNEKVEPTRINNSLIQNVLRESKTENKGKEISSYNHRSSLSPTRYNHHPSLFPMPKITKPVHSLTSRILPSSINVDDLLKNSRNPHTNMADQDMEILGNEINEDKEGESGTQKLDLTLKL